MRSLPLVAFVALVACVAELPRTSLGFLCAEDRDCSAGDLVCVEHVCATRDGGVWRRAASHPFASDAPWNTAIGSGAIYQSATDTQTAQLLTGNPAINSANWSMAIFQATTDDPEGQVIDTSTGQVHHLLIPPTTINGRADGGIDRMVGIIQPDGHSGWEIYGMNRMSDGGWSSDRAVLTDLRDDGMSEGLRGSGVSFYVGLIRAEEVARLSIRHALAVALPLEMLQHGPVWPAWREDRSGESSYAGTIPVGSLLAIPADVDFTALELSPEGLALANALRDYGAYVLGSSANVSLYCEFDCDREQTKELARAWQSKLFPLVRVVTNSTARNVAGGGVRRQPPLEPLAP